MQTNINILKETTKEIKKIETVKHQNTGQENSCSNYSIENSCSSYSIEPPGSIHKS